jgi:hypothetical protein
MIPLFDPATVPWPTTYSDWALCLVPALETHVWVEHILVARVLPGTERWDPAYHSAFVAIGARVAALLAQRPGLLVLDKMVLSFQFSEARIDGRISLFGGQVFVFTPKPELEREWKLPQGDPHQAKE